MNKTKIECCKCSTSITQEIDGYELCPDCYAEALENQRLMWKELAQWVEDNHLYVMKVTLTGKQKMPR